jgi:8-oxo-dGTP pyrophosphatase MutT (NUDIX family)
MEQLIGQSVIEASGALVERHVNSDVRIAVIYRERYGGAWELPKGKREPGETWQDTAFREIYEEIGLRPKIISVAGASCYLAGGEPKLVLYWRMSAEGQGGQLFEPNEEVKMLEWLVPEEAVRRLTHREQAELVRVVYRVKPEGRQGLDRYKSRLLSLLQRSRLQRLDSEIDAYRLELSGMIAVGAPSAGTLAQFLPAITAELDNARQSADDGQIDKGWKCLHAAKRLQYLATPDEQSLNVATIMRAEASKLVGWRKTATDKLFETSHKIDGWTIYLASTIRDEHYDNEAYKDGLRRVLASWLAAALFCALLLTIFWAHYNKVPLALDDASKLGLFRTLLGAIILGFLGAAVSAVLAAPTVDGPSRIPEMVASFHVTVLRLLMGPAAATLMFLIINSNLYAKVFAFGPLDTYAVLAISFVAGFSERLVLRVVKMIAEKP